MTDRSEAEFERARRLMPGGVSSPVRAFGAVGGTPRFMAYGSGAHVTDVDGRTYIDLLGSWGPLILGHAHPKVVEAVDRAVRAGTTFGAPTPWEADLADLIARAVPSVEMIRFVSSGTEASMSALRLARAATGRDKIVKFAGCYHGHADSLLASAGSGVVTLGLPDSPGVPQAMSAATVVVPFNSSDGIDRAFSEFGHEIAAVIVEPVAANMGVVPPIPGFLEHLRKTCDSHDSLLIFDEVITGFRVGFSGAQGMFGILPDLTTFGKVIGGGLPVGAYGGRADLMEMVAPAGPVYQAGTLSGNPVAVAAGIATLTELQSNPGIYPEIDRLAERLHAGIELISKESAVESTVQRVGSMFTVFFNQGAVTDLESAKKSDTARFAEFFHEMLAKGIYWPPAQFEAAFVSAAHTDSEIDQVLDAIAQSFKKIARSKG